MRPPKAPIAGALRTALAALCALLWIACSDGEPPAPDGAADAAQPADSGAQESGSGWPDLLPRVDQADPCALERKAVEAEMSKINHCHQPLECTSMPGVCPFGCHIGYNKQEDPSKLGQLMSAYKANTACMQCSYGCPPAGQLICEGGRCKVTKLP